MNIKSFLYKVSLAVVTLIYLNSTSVLAGITSFPTTVGPSTSGNNAVLQKGSSFVSRGATYEFMINAQVSKEKPSNQKVQPKSNSSNSFDSRVLVAKKGPFYIYANKNYVKPATATSSQSCGFCQVAVNRRTGNYAIVTGEIEMSNITREDANEVASKAGLKLYRYYPRLRLAFFKVPNRQVLSAYNKIKPLNASANISVVEHFKVPL